jgi:hypothetical protein
MGDKGLETKFDNKGFHPPTPFVLLIVSMQPTEPGLCSFCRNRARMLKMRRYTVDVLVDCSKDVDVLSSEDFQES